MHWPSAEYNSTCFPKTPASVCPRISQKNLGEKALDPAIRLVEGVKINYTIVRTLRSSRWENSVRPSKGPPRQGR